jgi:hypothetical protein
MEEQKYHIKISPEVILSDLRTVIFTASTGGHPIGEVFLIMKPTVSAAVKITMFLSNLLVTYRK